MEVLDLRGTSPNAVQYAVLKSFWRRFGKNGHKHIRSSQPKQETLDALKDIGEMIVLRKFHTEKTTKGRNNFEVIKHKRHSLKTHPICFACRKPAEVRHHVIWLRHGGLNSKKNLVSLCKPCHAYIHPWLD